MLQHQLRFAAFMPRDVATKVPKTDVFVFSYVCHETSARTTAANLAFYTETAKAAKPGSVFIFMDVMRHSEPHLKHVAQAMTQACDSMALLNTSIPSLNALPTQLLILSKNLVV